MTVNLPASLAAVRCMACVRMVLVERSPVQLELALQELLDQQHLFEMHQDQLWQLQTSPNPLLLHCADDGQASGFECIRSFSSR